MSFCTARTWGTSVCDQMCALAIHRCHIAKFSAADLSSPERAAAVATSTPWVWHALMIIRPTTPSEEGCTRSK